MKLIVSFCLIFIALAIVSTEAQRIVCPIPKAEPESGVDYEIQRDPPRRPGQTETRVARSIDDRQAQEILDSDPEIELHPIEKRDGGRRVVINYKPPPANGPRHARDVEEAAEIAEYEPEVDYDVQKRNAGSSPQSYRYVRDVEEGSEIENYEPEAGHIVEKREPNEVNGVYRLFQSYRTDRNVQDLPEDSELAEEFGQEPIA